MAHFELALIDISIDKPSAYNSLALRAGDDVVDDVGLTTAVFEVLEGLRKLAIEEVSVGIEASS